VKIALSIDPNYAEAYNNLGVLYRDEGRIDRAILCYEQCIRLNPLSHDAAQNRLLALNYLPNISLHDVYLAHQEWGRLFESQFPRFADHEVPSSWSL
jgi:protein O-GlcNAc transferase